MFHQNSNDLVKNASAKSGHVQNSKETREIITATQTNTNESNSVGHTDGENILQDIGSQFQNMVHGLFSTKESLVGSGGAAPANPATGIGGDGKQSQASFINSQVEADKKYTQQELDHIKKVQGIMNLIEKDDKNRRQNWVEVTDNAGVTKYGYITKDGVFQIWHVPSSSSSNPTNWLETDTMKQNAGVIGCPAPSGTTQKIKIAGAWDNIKPYDLVYADSDSERTNPLFMLINNAVRDPNNSINRKGLFSCGNERGNVYVSERPSADFQFPGSGVDTIQMGCYVIADKVTDSDLTNRGFTFQDDLHEATISQCKRRAEDLGSSYFLISAPEKDKANNRGGCWVYTSTGKPNINGILTLNNDETKCHNVGNAEPDEDGFMKSYATTTLKRMYGKTNAKSSTDYTSKGDGFWASEGPNQYQCSGAKGRNTTGNYGDFDRYCIFDKAEDAENWCSSDPNCIGYTNMRNKFYQATKKNPYVTSDDSSYFVKSTSSRPSQAVALYSLKKGGPTGVDEVGRNGTGYVGRISYVDHNGERHDYPASALSYMAPTKNEKGETMPATYLNMGGYDTRSAESSYSLKEITPGSFSDAGNLLYKASRDGWSPQRFHQLCDNKGATYTRAIINDGRVLGAYTSLSWSSTDQNYHHDTTAFLYDGTTKYPSTNGTWGAGVYATYTNNSYYPTFGGGHDMYIWGQNMYNNAYTFRTSDGRAPFGRTNNSYQQYTLSDLEVYSVDANTFPTTLNFERRLRTMPVGESITASFEKCRGMCDADDKCGGFVYTKGTAGTDGKCELKDRAKMYPVGLRIADPTKQLMLKVPTINGTISDESCKVNNGAYKMIDSAQYQHYPDTGGMASGTKCDIRKIVPKGPLQETDLRSMFGAVDKAFEETESKTSEYRAQTAIAPPPSRAEGFGVLREGIDNYGNAISGVADDLKKIANSEYQRERLLAMNDETNKLLISESYKFILWSILAILTVMAVLKLKEMFGQEDAEDTDSGSSEGGAGLLATILGWFGVGTVKTDDIPDRTEDVKAAFSSAGEQLKNTGENLATSITEGADNLVTSANDAAVGAVEGANNMVDKAKEAASGAIDKIGAAATTATTATTAAVQPPTAPTTGGKRSMKKNNKK